VCKKTGLFEAGACSVRGGFGGSGAGEEDKGTGFLGATFSLGLTG
jgi:hypothetical protein